MERLRILLVGFGVRGRQWRAALAARSDMDLAGIIEPTAGAVPQEQVPVWPALDRSLADEVFDAAIICSPPGSHVDDAVRCLEAGIAVLVEKPMAPSVVEAARLLRAAREADRPAIAGQNFRHRPYEVAARGLLAEGAVGEPRFVDVLSRRRGGPRGPARGVHLLWDYCLHHFDLLRTRFDIEPTLVSRAVVDDHVVEADLAFGDTLRAEYRHVEAALRFRYRERIRGSLGQMTIRVSGVRVSGGRTVHSPSPVSGEDGLLDELRSSIEGEPSDLSLEDNVRTVALVEAVARSAREHGAVAPTELLNEAGLASLEEGSERG